MSKFTVIKNTDLTEEQQHELVKIMREIAIKRQDQGKKIDNRYLVINQDEPYADEVIQIMKRHGHWG